ncbi:MAG TPA: hypothetical protein VLE73_06785 [Candidatus Saccharimonadales bacterium]|nr:hypothetical protein [Candidatus Saccharimonadales bacterium]
METHTAPRPETTPIVIDSTVVDPNRFRATARVPRPGASMPSMEARLPGPIKLDAHEVQKRITPIAGAGESRRGSLTITSAKSRLGVQQERVGRALTSSFAAQALGKVVKYAKARKEEWKRDRYW